MFWKRNPHKEQLCSIFDWLSGVVNESDVIHVNLPGELGYFNFEFPLKYGDRPQKISKLPNDRDVTFFIRRPELEAPGGHTAKIFSSPELEVRENTSRPVHIRPLRWGLDEEERITALKIARHALEKFFMTGERLGPEYFGALHPRFYLRADLDVSLWAGGRLRGSVMAVNSFLGEGVAEAALAALHDMRFKPLAKEELPHTRIEITLMRHLRMALSQREIDKNVHYPEKGYLLELRDRKGWYLPEVLNVRKFQGLGDFLEDLAEEKAGLERSAYKNASIFIFDVEDFIESEDHETAIALWGPIVAVPTTEEPEANRAPSEHGVDFLPIDRLRLAAEWICNIQELDGNTPPVINTLTGRRNQIDWPRLAFTAWALAEFGEATGEERYQIAAARSFDYLKKHLNLFVPHGPMAANHKLTLAYFGRLALSLGKPDDAVSAASRILPHLDDLAFEPITFSQVAGFLEMISKSDKQYLEPYNNLIAALKNNFENNEKRKIPMELAAWAELARTFSEVDPKFADHVAAWLKSRQLPSGAFPESTSSNFVYTRGTGKIFEVLALNPQDNFRAIRHALHWLLIMQYDKENTFFIPESVRPAVLGGFRHDYLNQDAWIDAAGHVLLGASRLLIKNKR